MQPITTNWDIAKQKIAKVIPIYKIGDKHVFTNNRAVSLLQFSKILEQMFNDKLSTFLDKHKIMNDSQFGFRTGRSTSMAIIEAVEEITNALANNKKSSWNFWGLKKSIQYT